MTPRWRIWKIDGRGRLTSPVALERFRTAWSASTEWATYSRHRKPPFAGCQRGLYSFDMYCNATALGAPVVGQVITRDGPA